MLNHINDTSVVGMSGLNPEAFKQSSAVEQSISAVELFRGAVELSREAIILLICKEM